MEKLSKEMAKKCRCFDCATYKLNKLSGDPFCQNGVSAVAAKLEFHSGCECQGCPIREAPLLYADARAAMAKLGLPFPESAELEAMPIKTGVLFCMLENGEHYAGAFEEHGEVQKAHELPPKDAPRQDVNLTLKPLQAGAGVTEPKTRLEEDK